MGYQYVIVAEGCEIKCEGPDAALALARAARRVNGKQATTSAADAERTRRQRKPLDHALAFLSTIKDAGEKGIGGEQLRRRVGLESAAGLGTTVQNARRFLNEAGIQFDAVARKKRSGNKKLWVASASIEQGILAIKNKLNELFPLPL